MNKGKQITHIFFDIDFTLVNTDELHRHIISNILHKPSQFPHTANSLFQFFSTPPGTNSVPLFRGTWLDPAEYKKSMYPDVLPALQSMTIMFQLGIFSQSRSPLQRLKIELSGLSSFFRKDLIFIAPHKWSVAKKVLPTLGLEKVAVIDDRIDICNQAAKLGVQSFLIDRENNKIAPKNTIGIQSLTEILTHITS